MMFSRGVPIKVVGPSPLALSGEGGGAGPLWHVIADNIDTPLGSADVTRTPTVERDERGLVTNLSVSVEPGELRGPGSGEPGFEEITYSRLQTKAPGPGSRDVGSDLLGLKIEGFQIGGLAGRLELEASANEAEGSQTDFLGLGWDFNPETEGTEEELQMYPSDAEVTRTAASFLGDYFVSFGADGGGLPGDLGPLFDASLLQIFGTGGGFDPRDPIGPDPVVLAGAIGGLIRDDLGDGGGVTDPIGVAVDVAYDLAVRNGATASFMLEADRGAVSTEGAFAERSDLGMWSAAANIDASARTGRLDDALEQAAVAGFFDGIEEVLGRTPPDDLLAIASREFDVLINYSGRTLTIDASADAGDVFDLEIITGPGSAAAAVSDFVAGFVSDALVPTTGAGPGLSDLFDG